MEKVIELTDEQSRLFGLVQARDQILLVAVGDGEGAPEGEVRGEVVRGRRGPGGRGGEGGGGGGG
jgi:hypothetical protein